jgi:DNA (cytosine-5)-methyltransferase 1
MDSVIQPDTAKKINLTPAPWTMHEFFAGSGFVAYGLKGMFRTVWSNDICPQKAAVYQSNFESNPFILDDIKNISGGKLPEAHLSWASFPCQDLSLAGSIGGIDAKRSGLVWEWLRILKEMQHKPSLLLIENVIGLLSTNNGANYIKLHNALLELGYKSGAIVLDAALFVPQSRPRVLYEFDQN